MSFVRFQKSAKARRWVQVLLFFIALIFVVGAFWSFGSAPQLRRGPQKQIVMKVNGVEITADRFWRLVENYESYFGRGPQTHFATIYQAVEGSIRDTVIKQQAASLGIKPTRAEIDAKKDEFINSQFEAAGEEGTPERQRFLVAQNTTWEAFKTQVKRDAEARRGSFEQQIIEDQLKESLTSDVTVSDAELLAKYRKFKVSQIYVKAPTEREVRQWEEMNAAESEPEAESGVESGVESGAAESSAESAAESAAPESAAGESGSTESSESSESEDPDRPKWLDRTKEEAFTLADEIHKRLADDGEDFAEVAKAESDDMFTASQGGDLGEMDYQGLQRMPEELRDVLYEMEVGGLSDPIETDEGCYILRLESIDDAGVPADFEDTKEDARATELESKKGRVYQEKIDAFVKEATVEFEDKEAQVAWLMFWNMADRTPDEDEAASTAAIALLEEIIAERQKEVAENAELSGVEPTSPYEGLSSFYFQLGLLHADAERWEQAYDALKIAAEVEPVWEIEIQAARCLVELDRKDEVLPLLEAVSEDVTGQQAAQVHAQLYSMYMELGEDDLAQAEMQKATEAQAANPYGGAGGGIPMGM